MGLSASQARLMSLTSRMSDLELRAQQISNSKVRLADMAEEASQAYSAALDKQILRVFSGLQSDGTSSYIEANAANLTTYNSALDKQRFIKNSNGQVLVSTAVKTAFDANSGSVTGFITALRTAGVMTDTAAAQDSGQVSYYTNLFNEINQDNKGCFTAGSSDNFNSAEWLQAQVDAGNLFLYVYDKDGGTQGTGDFVNVSWNSGDASLQEKTDETDRAKAEAEYETTMASIKTKDERFDLQLKEIDTEHTAVQTEMESIKKVIGKNIERSMKVFDA